ncbi:MAG: hypothetical protein VX017_10495, partial [Pseudomonadota bacterium]|nr:hypothetical protein [Pseudomonadota bacterium]
NVICVDGGFLRLSQKGFCILQKRHLHCITAQSTASQTCDLYFDRSGTAGTLEGPRAEAAVRRACVWVRRAAAAEAALAVGRRHGVGGTARGGSGAKGREGGAAADDGAGEDSHREDDDGGGEAEDERKAAAGASSAGARVSGGGIGGGEPLWRALRDDGAARSRPITGGGLQPYTASWPHLSWLCVRAAAARLLDEATERRETS